MLLCPGPAVKDRSGHSKLRMTPSRQSCQPSLERCGHHRCSEWGRKRLMVPSLFYSFLSWPVLAWWLSEVVVPFCLLKPLKDEAVYNPIQQPNK